MAGSTSGETPRKRTSSRAHSASSGSHDNQELRASDDVRTAIITGATFRNKAVQYAVVEGLAMLEGDINLGPADDVAAQTESIRSGLGDVEAGVIISGSQFRWPQGQLPYDIDGGMPKQDRVTDAIAHWEHKTVIRFVLRTPANAASFPNYVHFFQGSGCYSSVGMQGGSQDISLGVGCTTGNAIHEIGHTVGLFHEQSREDRDSFVIIGWANIQAGKEHNFDQHVTDGDDVGGYDYASIMHYPRDAFSSNGLDTITPTNPANAAIGQRNGLSVGDVAAVVSMYGGGVPTFKKAVDDPRTGIKKTLDDRPPVVLKKSVDDPPVSIKKTLDDRPPILKKTLDDPPVNIKKLLDDPRIKKISDDFIHRLPPGFPSPGPGPLTPGGLSPFLLSTAHHADVGALGSDEEQAAVAELLTQIQESGAQVQDARRNVVALQTALTAATSELAKAQESYAAALQILG